MILSGHAIRRAIKRGKIVITPLDPEQIDQAGITLHLHPRVLVRVGSAPLDVRVDDAEAFEPVRPYHGEIHLYPGSFYLGSTIERIHAPRHVVRVDGKSSLGRKGLEVHRTAGHVEPGFDGQITLEMAVLEELIIVPGWPICQAVFHEVTGKVELYGERGHYRDASTTDGPQTSRSHLHKPRHV